MNNDPYKILQVSRKSSPQDIIKSFKKLRYKYHPDRPTGNREMYDQIIEAYDTIKKYPQKYINVSLFIDNYKGSEDEYADIIGKYEEYKGDMRKILDNLILAEDEDEERIRKIIDKEISLKKIKRYTKYTEKMKKRKDESKKAEEIAKKMGINLKMSLEDLLNREDDRHEDMIKKLEDKYGKHKELKE
jgi:DnaJ homolog subfamily C member 9